MEQTKEEALAGMDGARDKAAEDLKQVIAQHPEGVEAVARWWKEHYIAAGHKRLGRLLVSVA